MKSKIIIDFKNERIVDDEKILRFYEKKQGSEVIEYAEIKAGQSKIKYINEYGDVSYSDSKNINSFIFNIYNKINEGTDSLFKKTKNSKPFYEVKVIGETIPLAVFLLIDDEVKTDPFKLMNLEYKINDKKDNDAGINLIYDYNDTKKYLSLYPKDSDSQRFANGLNTYKIKGFKTTKDGLEGIRDVYIQKVIDKKGAGFAGNVFDISSRFIDGNTRNLLKELNYKTTLSEVYAVDMVNMINQRTPKSQYDLDNYRLRMSETVTSIAYNQLHQAIKKFKSSSELSKSKIDVVKSHILDELVSAGILQYSKTLNPLEEAMLSLKVTKTGIGNVLKSQVTLNRRDLNKSYFGIIAPTATNEYGGIGVNQTLTNGAIIENRFGEIKKKQFNNESNAFENLSPVESLSAFFEYDDTTRRVMSNQQTGQFTQLNNPDVPLVQTGFESYIPHLVSDRFSKKAKMDGKIEKVDDDSIKIKYSDGSVDTINTKMVKSRTKRGIYIGNDYNNLVKTGQKVKAGDLLSVSNSMKTGKLAIGRNLVVAEMGYLGMNYEDGWVISDTLSKKYKNSTLQKINIMVPYNSRIIDMNLEEGVETKAGDILFEYTTNTDIQAHYDNDDESDDYENVMIGLETKGATNKYSSPGGKIKEIVVKINNPNMDKRITALHKKLTEHMKLKIDRCQKECDGDSTDYADCIGHLENVESLVIGKHKFNQEEFDGALIEVYIEQDNPIINGSKFTLTSSGGKGTVQYIMKNGMEPIANETGLKIEFVGTSLSIISRKNPSILLSMYLGKVIYFLNKAVEELAKQNKVLAIKKLVLEVFSCIDKTDNNIIIDELKKFFIKPGNEIVKFINSRDPLNNPAFPALMPPFKNKITIKNIQEAANVIGIPLNEKVRIMENNGILTVIDVPVGILPVNMLEHFPKAMSSTRGSIKTGKNWITGQGRNGTKEGTGATKVGLFDMNALTSKGSFGLLKELHLLKSDANGAKENMKRTIMRENRIPDKDDIKITSNDFTSKNMVDVFFKGAGLEFEF